jgi:hypothetical protein
MAGYEVGTAGKLRRDKLDEASLRDLITSHPSTAAAMAGVLITLLFYAAAWWLVGRDPPHGVVIPQFEPPDGLAPDEVRYLYVMADDRKVFAAALVNMAVSGFLKISQSDETFTLERTGQVADDKLPPTEAAAAAELFRDGAKHLELTPLNSDCVQDAIIKQAWSLNDTCGKYFAKNTGWLVAGIGILVLTVIAAILLTDDPGGTAVDMVALALLIAIMVSMLRWTWKLWRGLRKKHGVGSILGVLLASILTFFFATLIILMATRGFESVMPYATTGTLLAGGAMAWLFYYVLKRQTPEGVGVADRIEGFKMFLEASEKDRLEMLNPPEVTPELFEKYLPYAIALNCENKWAKHFEAQASAAAVKPVHYQPGWFVGTRMAIDALSSIATLGTSIGSAAAAAAVSVPVRPTHVGLGGLAVSGLLAGVGFSGGGRGGGGGGGW